MSMMLKLYLSCSRRGLVFHVNVPYGRQGRIWCCRWSEHRASSLTKISDPRVDLTPDVCTDPDARLVRDVHPLLIAFPTQLVP
jgi:hypothetical protein